MRSLKYFKRTLIFYALPANNSDVNTITEENYHWKSNNIYISPASGAQFLNKFNFHWILFSAITPANFLKKLPFFYIDIITKFSIFFHKWGRLYWRFFQWKRWIAHYKTNWFYFSNSAFSFFTLQSLFFFIYIYHSFIWFRCVNFFFFFKINLFKSLKLRHQLTFNFNLNNKLYASFRFNSPRKLLNITQTSPGLFIKFFQKKKSLKKTKLTKILTLKFYRKLFALINIKKLTLFIKHTPISIQELLQIFHQPIFILVRDTSKSSKDKKSSTKKVQIQAPLFTHFVFLNTKSYSLSKKKSGGRIKRKIIRKIIKTNFVVD